MILDIIVTFLTLAQFGIHCITMQHVRRNEVPKEWKSGLMKKFTYIPSRFILLLYHIRLFDLMKQ